MDQDRYQPYRDVGIQPLVQRPAPLSLPPELSAKRTPQAELAMNALVGEIQSLHADVSVLLNRLAPVLRPEPPTKELDGASRPITGAALVDGIQDQVAQLVRLRGIVQSALDRLEV